jgi:hypothetical protein
MTLFFYFSDFKLKKIQTTNKIFFWKKYKKVENDFLFLFLKLREEEKLKTCSYSGYGF